MKVFELAKELTVQSKEIVSLLKENGEADISHMTVLTDDQIDFIRSEFSTASKVEEERLAKEAKAKAEAEAAIKEQKKAKEKKRTDADYRPDEMIPCRSIFPGVLLFSGTHSGMTYTFTGIGDRRNVEYQDLKAGLLEQRSSMFNPDFIIEANKPSTALILKEIEINNEKFKTILRLATSKDDPKYKNSIITFMKIDEKEWNRIINNKKVLYKSE